MWDEEDEDSEWCEDEPDEELSLEETINAITSTAKKIMKEVDITEVTIELNGIKIGFKK